MAGERRENMTHLVRIAALALPLLALGAELRQAEASGLPHCQALNVPVTVAGAPGAFIHGELCLPPGPPPAAVQLLVHSTFYNLRYWDPPQVEYSYVRSAVAAGYATFNLDRLGTGRSSKPPAHLVNIESVEDTLHQVIVKLRAGAIGGHAFTKVVWVGSSFGSAYGWVNATRHPGDADAYVLTGIAHQTKASFVELVVTRVISACDDAAFQHLGLDCGYVTNQRLTKGDLYYYPPTAVPGMLAGVDDFVIRDVVSTTLLGESALQLGGVTTFGIPAVFTPMPIETDFARAILVPTLLVMGSRDNIFCGPPDGLDCTPAAFQAFEAPYYGVVPDVYIAPDAGHATALHLSGPATSAAMNAWIDTHVGAN
jgi:pimeloyl-ACP methyl ester carboxylesterase